MPYVLEPGECVVGIDIGGTNIVAAVLDHEFRVVGRAKRRSRSKRNDVATEKRVFQAVRQAMDKAGVASVRGIGAGAPGPLDPVAGVILETPNLNWRNFPLADALSEEFGVRTVVDNDVNLGTYGEWLFGDVADCSDVIGVFPGTGIGGGIIVGGKIHHGFSGSAGEVGHMTVMEGGPFCGCGKRGCLEAVASRVAIAEQVAALALRYDAPYILKHCGTDLGEVRSTVLAKAIAAGESKVEAVVRRAAHFVGVAVSNLINVLSPEAVVLGGGLVEAMESLYLEEVKGAVEEHAMPALREGVRITPAKLGDDAVVMGAAGLVLARMEG